jgi:hypothetical protein
MSIRGFLSDRSLIDSTLSMINLEKANLPCGYLDRDTIEYFVEPLEITDPRSVRLPILYRREASVTLDDEAILTDIETTIEQAGERHLLTNPSETVTLGQYTGLDFLEFETDILPTDPTSLDPTQKMSIVTDATKLTDDDVIALNGILESERECLFNIVEYLSYGTISTDQFPDINTVLLGDPRYLGYAANSVKYNPNHVEAKLYGGLNIHRFIPDSIQFDFFIGSRRIDIQIWLVKHSFRTEYPYCTIINIVPPMALDVLLNPSSLTDPIASAALSKEWSDAILDPEIDNRDQSGMYQFVTRYIYNNKTYSVSFGLIYRGVPPDALMARQYIANFLLTSGIGTRALWQRLMPDIFYDSAFAIIPFYDNITVLTNADVYPSIINMLPLLGKMNSIMSLLPRANDPHREFMTAAYDKFFIGVAPSDVNVHTSLLEIHPTYRSFSTIEAGFTEMTSSDQTWSVLLNQALSVASGQTNLLTMNSVQSGGLIWINFVFENTSYLVLTLQSYKDHFNL